MAKVPGMSKSSSNLEDWNGVVSTDDGDGPTLVTFGRRRSSQGGDSFQKKLSSASFIFGTKGPLEEFVKPFGSREFEQSRSRDEPTDPAATVKRAMRAKAGKRGRLPLISELEEESCEDEQDTPLVEISVRRKASDREGGRQSDLINQSVLADTPGADSYVPYGYGSFRVETGKLGLDAKTGTSRLPGTLPNIFSTDLGSETEEEGEDSEPRRAARLEQSLIDDLSAASLNGGPETKDTSTSSFSMSTENGEGRSSSFYRSLRGKSMKKISTKSGTKSTKSKTHFITNVSQNTLMSDLTTILETKFCCGIQRKKDELKVAASLSGQVIALVLDITTMRNSAVSVTFRKSKVDRSKVAPETLLEFYKQVMAAFENMHGKGSVLTRKERLVS